MQMQTKIANRIIRFINAYGPQEDEKDEIRKSFYSRLDQETKRSKLAGTMICLEMDANAKLGSGIIRGDPKDQSKNGKLLENVIVENDLVVVNAQDICKGVITRYRKTVSSEERSVLDYFIVCKRFYAMVKNMIIDEERAYCQNPT